jgi:hypothetical protein
MIELIELLHRGPLEWHYLHTKFLENLPSCSEVIGGGGGAYRQTDTHRKTNRLVI